MLTESNLVNLTTPFYPVLNYPDNTYCKYNITVPDGKRVLVEFLDFHLEDTYDFLNVDGILYTGRDVPDTYLSTTNTLNLWFSSDVWGGEKGYLLRLSSVLVSGMFFSFVLFLRAVERVTLIRFLFGMHPY